MKSFYRVLLLPVLILTVCPLTAADWQYYYRRGTIHYNARLYKFALEDFSRAMEINPGLHDAANKIAGIYMMKKDVLKAFGYYKKSLEISDTQPEIHLETGNIYEYFYQSDTAFSHFKKAAELDPSLAAAHLKLVPHYIRRGDMTQAETHLRKSYSLCRDKSIPFITEAEKFEAAGDIDKAEAQYRKALRNNPADIELRFKLSRLSRRKGRYRSAVRYLEGIVSIRPDSESAYLQLAHLYFTAPLSGNKKMMIDISLKSIGKVLSLNPENSSAYILLGDIHRYLGNTVEAEKYEAKAAELGAGKTR
ncbi:MAG TPA: tetratricopeptide repeat protein [Spirochaetota bacterium]|nr:tetratricopeptide repeat protein [Spirochaetota bacterium]